MTIGIVGGMGSYATLNFFDRYLAMFPADKEWDRPRIVIDNRCTMPSRVRAILYNEKWDEVVGELTSSIQHLMSTGCDRIILACNTSHVFLDDVYKRIPEAEGKVVHIIDTLCKQLSSDKHAATEEYSLISTEGTILSGIYQRYFNKYDLKIIIPGEEEFSQLRFFIEAVKTNTYNDKILADFARFLKSQPSNNVILGCTEFPVIYDHLKKQLGVSALFGVNAFDPLEASLKKLRLEFEQNVKA